ncbi:fungal-trans domain-containing protein [Favolaschia claudopus]|uniref:Fungal-trans domain-containing protein n=1 Tax=Favolaschia claudopus TaxID=2862362 RepID=A0AAW0EFS8_9AGAR
MPDSEKRISLRKRRPGRSCDNCRRRKGRCDGQNLPNSSCSNCISFGTPCTYDEPAKKRGRKDNVVEELEREIAALKARLRAISVCSLCAQPLIDKTRSASVFESPDALNPENDADQDSDSASESDESVEELASRFRRFEMDDPDFKQECFGSASSFALADHVISMKETDEGSLFFMNSRRPLYWDLLPWERDAYAEHPKYMYPAKDLMQSLLQLYLINVHPTFPILHFPSFSRSVEDGLHLTNAKFGGALLALLAVASRYSKDPRVFVNGDTSLLSAGWTFFHQILNWFVPKNFQPTIYDVQMYGLMSMYSCGISAPQNSWLYLGLGIRCLHHRGAHRKRPGEPDLQAELWKRAFWSFVLLDRMVSGFAGRPMSLHTEDYDVEPPLEVDDEYFDQGFIQPPDKPSQMSFFVYDLKLGEIWGDAMRKLYATKKAKLLMGWDSKDWEQQTVAKFDSVMNDFLDSIPSHLKWDPERLQEGVFFEQSVVLNVTYHYLHIVIHRPYIHKSNTLRSTSLSICVNAARTILRIADVALHKIPRIPSLSILNCVHVAGLILTFNILAAKRVGLVIDKWRDSALIATALETLKSGETRYQPLGRIRDLLQEISSSNTPSPKNRHLNPLAGVGELTEYQRRIDDESRHVKSSAPQHHLLSGATYYSTTLSGGSDSLSSAASSFDLSASSPPVSSDFHPGMSIEELLADADANPAKSVLEDELMSLWTAVPGDFVSFGNWNSYLGTANGEWLRARGM